MTAARVIGAGISGLAAAWHLAERGFAVTVLDEGTGPGGLIHTLPSPHGLVETAANAFVWTEVVAAWFRRLDLEPAFARDHSKRRYIFRDGAPRRWPLSIGESAVLVARLSAAAASRRLGAGTRETIAEWGNRVLGPGAREWLLEPAMQGIYASPASTLSARAIFSGRRRGRRRMAAPGGGMEQFVSRLHARLADRGVQFCFNTRVDSIDAEVPTAICTGAPDAARLLAAQAPVLAACIGAVRTAPLVTVTAFFRPHPADLHGFGVLFPEAEAVGALGVLFNADIFEGRGDFRSETWIVGDRGLGMTKWTDSTLKRALAEDRARVTGRRDEPAALHITRWPRAVPVYDQAVLDVKASLATLPPRIALAGNYLGQIGVAALLDHAAAAAARLQTATKRSAT